MSLGVGQSMSHPGSTHKNNLPGSQNKSLTNGGESLGLKRGTSHNLQMKKTYYTKTDEGNYLPAHIGFNHIEAIEDMVSNNLSVDVSI